MMPGYIGHTRRTSGNEATWDKPHDAGVRQLPQVAGRIARPCAHRDVRPEARGSVPLHSNFTAPSLPQQHSHLPPPSRPLHHSPFPSLRSHLHLGREQSFAYQRGGGGDGLSLDTTTLEPPKKFPLGKNKILNREPKVRGRPRLKQMTGRDPLPILAAPETNAFLNFSPKVSGVVVFVLYPYGGGTPLGCGSACQLFLVPHSHELHMCFNP